VGATHLPFVQTPEPQSTLAPHALPSAQVGEHAGATQRPAVHAPLEQSPATLQV